MHREIKVIKNNRKSISIQIKADGSITVRAPRFVTMREIEGFVLSKEDWIEKTLKKLSLNEAKEKPEPVSPEELNRLFALAREIIPIKVKYYATIIGVSYNRITIRNQKTRWGSCSSDHNLNFNCQLMRLPEDVVDYVVVHELCHIKQMNHSKAFWGEVEKILPDYRERRKYLKSQILN